MAALDQLIDRFANVGNAAETAYAVLREVIVTKALKPGTRLGADELARKLGVSKTPVREALRKLEAEDLIAVQLGPGAGYCLCAGDSAVRRAALQPRRAIARAHAAGA